MLFFFLCQIVGEDKLTRSKGEEGCSLFLSSTVYFVFAESFGGCSVMAARKTSDLDSAYLQCAGAGSIPVTRSLGIDN